MDSTLRLAGRSINNVLTSYTNFWLWGLTFNLALQNISILAILHCKLEIIQALRSETSLIIQPPGEIESEEDLLLEYISLNITATLWSGIVA